MPLPKRPYVASADQVRITREGDSAIIEYVIVTELSSGPERYDVRMHVALTRATLACVVVGTEEEIARDPRLAAVR